MQWESREYCAWCNKILLPPHSKQYRASKKPRRMKWRELYFCLTDCLQFFLESKDRKRAASDRRGERNVHDFNSFYNRYPRKRGKVAGRKRFEKLLKEGWTVERMNSCLDRYLEEIRRLGTQPKYVRYFGTFMNNIEDYDGDDSSTPSANASLAQRVMEGDL